MKKALRIPFLLSVIFLHSCSNNTTTKDDSTVVHKNSTTGLVDLFSTIYLWGSETPWPVKIPILDRKAVDHAYATDFSPIRPCSLDSNYWYCLGVYHPTISDSSCNTNASGTLLLQGVGNINFASKLVKPNYNADTGKNVPAAYGDASGGMPWPYGAYGVCHQVANRAAYATYWKGSNSFGTPISLPKTLPGYRLTHFLYGTYGLDVSNNFVKRIDSLGGNSSYVGDNGDSLERSWLIEDFGQQWVDSNWVEYQNVRHEIQITVNKLVIALTDSSGSLGSGSSNKFDLKNARTAMNINQGIARLINQKLLPILRKGEKADINRKHLKMFGFIPSKELNIIDGSHIQKQL